MDVPFVDFLNPEPWHLSRRSGSSRAGLALPHGVLRRGLLALLAATALSWTALHAAEPSPVARPVDDAVARASALEQAGKKAEAARAYEEMVCIDPAKRKILAPRLVSLHATTGNADRALFWANEVMVGNPDPQAYLAGVHALLGQHAEASALLDSELARTNAPTRAVALRWQLADVQLRQGNTNAAMGTLRAAEETAKGTPLERPARQRIERLAPSDAPGNRAHTVEPVSTNPSEPPAPPPAADPAHPR